MRYLTICLVAGLILAVTATAGAVTTYGGNVSPLWNLGEGQPTGNFVVNDDGYVQTALRATGRYTGPLAPVTTEGRYFAFPGTSASPPDGAATWNFCFHANVDTSVLAVADSVSGLVVPSSTPSRTFADVNIYLIVDADPAVGVSTGLILDLKQLAEYAAGAATIDWTYFVGMRGSENLGFSWLAMAAAAQSKTWNFDPNVAGEYEFSLAVYDKDATPNLLSQTDMKVTVVPEPLTMLGVFTGIAGLAGYIRRRKLA